MPRAMTLTIAALVSLAGAVAAHAAEFAGARSTFSPAGNSQNFDPYKNFRYRVLMDGRVVAGVNEVGGLDANTTEFIKQRPGGDQGSIGKLPGRLRFEPITIKRGATNDTSFEIWAQSARTSLPKTIQIQIMDERGDVAATYTLRRAWVSEYQAVPDLDAGAHAVAITSIKLENEGWERDPGVRAPSQ